MPAARAFHKGSASVGREPGPFTSLIIRNQILMLVKDVPWPLALRWGPRIAWFQLLWLPRNWRAGIGRHHLRALAGVARELPRTLRKRRAIQRRRTAGAAELARVIELKRRGRPAAQRAGQQRARRPGRAAPGRAPRRRAAAAAPRR